MKNAYSIQELLLMYKGSIPLTQKALEEIRAVGNTSALRYGVAQELNVTFSDGVFKVVSFYVILDNGCTLHSYLHSHELTKEGNLTKLSRPRKV
jgi:hypothetical protein